MPKPMAALLRDVVTPTLRPRGYRRSGGSFRYVNSIGDAALISLRTYPYGRHDLEFWVEVGFVTAEALSSSWNTRETPAERIQITDTYNIWWTRLRDPSLTVWDGNDHWHFDGDDEAMTALFQQVLDQAADDLLTRMRCWPESPRDCLSEDPQYRFRVDEGSRSAWFKCRDGGFDYLYPRFGLIREAFCRIGPQEFPVTLLFVDGRVMLELLPDAAAAVAGSRSMALLAEAVGLLPCPEADLFLLDIKARIASARVEHLNTSPALVMDGGQGWLPVTVPLGQLPSTTWVGYSGSDRVLTIEVLFPTEPWLATGTLRDKRLLASNGRAWYANVLAPV